MKNVLVNLDKELALYPQNADAVGVRSEINHVIDIPSALEVAQKGERILKMIKAGAYKNPVLVKSIIQRSEDLWSAPSEFSITQEEAYRIAELFFISNQKAPGERNLLKASHTGKEIIEAVVAIFEQAGKPLDDVEFDEPYFHTALLEATGEQWFTTLETRRLDKFRAAKKLINIRQNISTNIKKTFTTEANNLLGKYMKVWDSMLRSGELFYTLTVVPTREDAATDQMDYADYTKQYVQSIDQPWDEIWIAQELLIKKLDAGKEMVIRNEHGTNIRFSIEWMTFANSLVLKNIPWSEAFSAPLKYSVNGKIVAKWRFKFDNSPIIIDPRMYIEDGEIIACWAAENAEAFQQIIYKNPNANYFGEFGIGTNPGLTRHLINGLLVEKISGSFHMAVGWAYTYTSYDGQPVHLDNGNESPIHRDITIMLRDMKSEMVLDGEPIQANGKWLDPALSVLNEWRWALPEDRQPQRRKNKNSEKPTS